LNPCSSRSHFFGKLHGELHFVDLAGSERMSSSASHSCETKAINKSLSALKDVFEAIRNGSDYVSAGTGRFSVVDVRVLLPARSHFATRS
jgi:hypothetical protein